MRAAWLLLPLVLGACGLREPLRPAPGESMPPAPAPATAEAEGQAEAASASTVRP